ncbi:DapH/DapD/GlmU-related protein [Clostridium thermosuccinogenes]|uniref:DapH/DapD/GlmU-related protein n=1 Tax=Clostridium thermosuccinogenes TaxID=84032 RepID=UPI000CCC72CC|nr:DapH/DapD/GlmU-related protein [Pseudoclostridium thermosuccinogenes]PNT91552.1 acyltransferase [Pseudoclostridium thermosuccinogenes]
MSIIRQIIILFGRLIYGREYIRGKYFNKNSIGARWILQCWFWQKIMRYNSDANWPVSHRVQVSNAKNIIFDPDDMQIFHTFGSYFQAFSAKIIIGKGTWIAPNVGLITANHDFEDLTRHAEGKDIIIGEKCWIGMNSVILPGVVLGPNTIVGAGSIVTKSFPEGNCVIAGNPAKLIKLIRKSGDDNDYKE